MTASQNAKKQFKPVAYIDWTHCRNEHKNSLVVFVG